MSYKANDDDEVFTSADLPVADDGLVVMPWKSNALDSIEMGIVKITLLEAKPGSDDYLFKVDIVGCGKCMFCTKILSHFHIFLKYNIGSFTWNCNRKVEKQLDPSLCKWDTLGFPCF